jgi:hypothetical protein
MPRKSLHLPLRRRVRRKGLMRRPRTTMKPWVMNP